MHTITLRNLEDSQLGLIHMPKGMVVPCVRPALFHIATKQNGNRKPHHAHKEKERVPDVVRGAQDEFDNKWTPKRARLKKKISLPVRLRNRSASYFVRGGEQCILPDFFALQHKLCIVRLRIASGMPHMPTLSKNNKKHPHHTPAASTYQSISRGQISLRER